MELGRQPDSRQVVSCDMLKHPIEFGNIMLIIVGIVLLGAGPVIVYRTVRGMVEARRQDPKANLHWISNIINVIIGLLFFGAGICFIANNFRGNPLS
jgi:hypothetical protein